VKIKTIFIVRWITDVSLFLIVFYVCAVVASFSLVRYGQWQYNQTLKSQPDRKYLSADSLAKNIKIAELEGYERIIRPASLIYNKKLRRLAEQTNFVPLGSQPSTNVYICDEGYGLIRENLDRMGFRNNDRVWDNTNKIDIILVGDSIVFGECVSRSNTIAAKLLSSGANVVSLGIGANDPYHYAYIQKAYIPKVKPKFVVTVFFSNDRSIYRNTIFDKYFAIEENIDDYLFQDEFSLTLSKKASNFHAESLNHIYFEKKGIHFIEDKFRRLYTRFIYSRHWGLIGFTPYYEKFISNNSSIDPGTRYAVDTAVSLCKEHACTPIFVYVPNDDVWYKDKMASKYRYNLEHYLNKENQKFIDTTADIKALGLDGYAPNGMHPSGLGYHVIGEAISKVISD